MPKWDSATPEARASEWLVAGDAGGHISEGMSIEGDAVHVGWTVKLTAEDGVPITVVEKLLAAGSVALTEMMRTFDDGDGFTFDPSDG